MYKKLVPLFLLPFLDLFCVSSDHTQRKPVASDAASPICTHDSPTQVSKQTLIPWFTSS
jgi:hypothetical protein